MTVVNLPPSSAESDPDPARFVFGKPPASRAGPPPCRDAWSSCVRHAAISWMQTGHRCGRPAQGPEPHTVRPRLYQRGDPRGPARRELLHLGPRYVCDRAAGAMATLIPAMAPGRVGARAERARADQNRWLRSRVSGERTLLRMLSRRPLWPSAALAPFSRRLIVFCPRPLRFPAARRLPRRIQGHRIGMPPRRHRQRLRPAPPSPPGTCFSGISTTSRAGSRASASRPYSLRFEVRGLAPCALCSPFTPATHPRAGPSRKSGLRGRGADNDIRGDVLFDLSADTLRDMGITAAGDRLRVLRALDELRARYVRRPSE